MAYQPMGPLCRDFC